MKTRILSALLSVGTCVSFAGNVDTIVINGESWGKSSLALTNAQCLTSTTIAVDELPSSVPTPIFHIDASCTNGWEFTQIDGKPFVSRIPSKTGNGRSLFLGQPVIPQISFASVSGPEYVTNVSCLNGGPMLDFGKTGSKRGLVFDADAANANSNGLYKIGSIVAVYGSENGGGWLLGGGYGWNEQSTTDPYVAMGFLWHRGGNPYLASDNGSVTFANPIIRHPGHKSFVQSYGWLDGFQIIPSSTGFSANWQTLSMVAINNHAHATGIGINDSRDPWRSGGQQIAEMLFFSELLTDEQREQTEAYLMKKWFARNRAGYNSRTDLGELSMMDSTTTANADYAAVEIPEGETLNVGRLTGGLRGGALTKKGAGTLSIADAREYSGTIKVQEGVLRFPHRACPDALPTNSLLHLDASLVDTLDLVNENGTNYVASWRDAEGRTFKDVPRKMSATSADRRPVYRTNMLNGAPVVDFGPCSKTDGKFITSEKQFPGIATAFLVIGAHEGGGHLLGVNDASFFSRSAWNGNIFTRALWNLEAKDPTWGRLTMKDGKTFIDGIEVDPNKGLSHSGYQVVALRIPGVAVGCLGRAGGGEMYGGQRLAEVVLYNRVLTEEEMADAQAFLMRKWLKRDAPGYRGEVAVMRPDVLDVETSDGVVIDTEGDATVVVKSLKSKGTLVKRGAGTLAVENAVIEDVVIEGGSVENRVRMVADEDAEIPAADPIFHLDAAKLDTMIFRNVGGTNFVRRWYDVGGRNAAAEWDSSLDRPLPWLRPASEANANGLPVIDFGVRGSARALVFDKPENGIRSAYVLIGTQDGHGGFLLGSNGNYGNKFDFHRGGDDMSDDPARELFLYNGLTMPIWNGEIFIDGVKKDRTAGLNGGYQLVEVHTTAAAHASALACDRWWGDKTSGTNTEARRRTGGQRIGEVLLYDRVLTARERVATRNYLMKKWFGSEPQSLPFEAEKTMIMHNVSCSGDVEMKSDSQITVGAVTGDGSFTKRGDNTLSIADTTSFTGAVNVASGTLALTGIPPPEASEAILNDAIFHIDATRGLTCTTNAQGEISVTRWDNLAAANAGWSVKPAVNNPDLLENELNHLPIVDMGALGSEKYMLFKNANGENDRVKNIRAVFWVIGSQNGGGYLLGGGTNASNAAAHYNFHRGVTPGTNDIIGQITHENKLIGYPADPAVRNSKWYLNGKNVNPVNAALSGGYDMLSMVVSKQSDYSEAEGFAFDGRIWASRGSGQRLGEVLMFDRMLSDLERRQVEFYLQRKWGFSFFRASDESNADFNIASGATLSLGDTTQPVRGVCGNGTIANGTLEVQNTVSAGEGVTPGTLTVNGDLKFDDGAVWAIDLANDAADKIVVSGTCTFANPQKIELNNIDAINDLWNYSQVVMTAGAFANAQALAHPTFVTDIPHGVAVNLAVRNDEVVLKFRKLGLVITIR